MALLRNNAESGLANGTAVTAANSALPNAFTAVLGTITFDSVAASHGALGYLCAAAASVNTYAEWGATAGATNAGASVLYCEFPTNSAVSQPLLGWRSGGGGTGLFLLQRRPTGELFVTSDAAAGAVQGETTGVTATNTKYRIECSFGNGTSTNGFFTLRVYTLDSTAAIANLSLDLSALNLGTSTIGTMRIGRPAAIGTAWTYRFDDVAFQTGSSTLIGPVPANTAPVASAGADVTVEPWTTVTLTGTDTDAENNVSTREWTQLTGPAVTLGGTGAVRTFTAPPALTTQVYTFRYTVTDANGATSTDDKAVTVLYATERQVIAGVLTPVRFKIF